MAEILIADDEDLLRRKLSFIIGSSGHATKTAKTGVEAISQLRSFNFDIVICDLFMPDKGGMAVIDYVAGNRPGTKVIVITGYPSAESAINSLKKGVFDYFVKPFKIEDLLSSIKKALEREKSIPFEWDKLKLFGLTKKERALLETLVAEGITGHKELSERLSIKETTVKQHLANIYGKFDVNNKASLISAVINVLKDK